MRRRRGSNLSSLHRELGNRRPTAAAVHVGVDVAARSMTLSVMWRRRGSNLSSLHRELGNRRPTAAAVHVGVDVAARSMTLSVMRRRRGSNLSSLHRELGNRRPTAAAVHVGVDVAARSMTLSVMRRRRGSNPQPSWSCEATPKERRRRSHRQVSCSTNWSYYASVKMEGIEPPSPVPKTGALPLSYILSWLVARQPLSRSRESNSDPLVTKQTLFLRATPAVAGGRGVEPRSMWFGATSEPSSPPRSDF